MDCLIFPVHSGIFMGVVIFVYWLVVLGRVFAAPLGFHEDFIFEVSCEVQGYR